MAIVTRHHDAMTFNMGRRAGKSGVLRSRITRTRGQDEGMRGGFLRP